MLLLTSLAVAATVSSATIEAWMPGLMKSVEEETGRAFVEAPRVIVQDSATLLTIMEGQLREPGVVAAGAPGDERRIAAESVAVYLSADATIYVVDDNIRTLFSRTAFDERLLAPYLRCTLVHELTHALQHQHARAAGSQAGEAREVEKALHEGQAVLAARRTCESPAAVQLADVFHDSGVVSSRSADEPDDFRYAFAARFLERVLRHSGWEGVWRTLGHPPGARSVLVEAVAPTLMAGWSDLGPLRDVASAWVPEGEEGPLAGVVEPSWTLGSLWSCGLDPAWLLPAEGGLQVRRKGAEAEVKVFLGRVRDESPVVTWVDARRRPLRYGTVRLLLNLGGTLDSFSSGSLPGAAKLSMSRSALLRARVSRVPYAEAWGLRDGVLAAVAPAARGGTSASGRCRRCGGRGRHDAPRWPWRSWIASIPAIGTSSARPRTSAWSGSATSGPWKASWRARASSRRSPPRRCRSSATASWAGGGTRGPCSIAWPLGPPRSASGTRRPRCGWRTGCAGRGPRPGRSGEGAADYEAPTA